MDTELSPPVVLHVDDDEAVLDLGAVTFGRSDAEVTVLRHVDPDEALARLASTRVDCVVSDSIKLDDGTPFVVAARELDSSVPIVLFTGTEWEAVRPIAERVDTISYVQKGDGAATELGRQVREHLDSTATDLDDEWSVLCRHDWSDDEELTTRIVEAIEAHTGQAFETLPPLFDSVDADALTSLFSSVDTTGKERAVEVRFVWGEYELLVTDDGIVAVRSPVD